MTAIKNLKIKGDKYIEALHLVNTTTEIHESLRFEFDKKRTLLQSSIEEIGLTVAHSEYKKAAATKAAKKMHLITGEFSLKGRYNIEPQQPIEIEIFGNNLAISNIENIKPEVIDLITEIFMIEPGDLLFFHSAIDYQTDQLDFNFAFQTNNETHRVDKGSDIALLTPARKLTTGYTYRNRIDFSNTTIRELPNEIWNYPNYSFKIPYFLTNDPVDLLSRIRIATTGSYGGYLADLRFWSQAFRGIVDPFVKELKEKRWKSILTQWERFYINPDGQTYRVIKMQ